MHAIWKGSLRFGLVNIPVHLYTASREKEISFVLLHKKDLSEIRYARFCKVENKEVPWNEIVKGYEYKKGDFVIFDDKDFENVNLKKTKTIEIVNFVNDGEVDSVYFSKPYFLEPQENSESAYGLLREALRQSKKVGIARYVLKNREHLAVVRIYENILILNELRYHSELVGARELKIPAVGKINSRELSVAVQLIDHLTMPFKAKEYRDTFTEELRQMIKMKARGRPIHPKTEAPPTTKIHDIMSLLKASLTETKKKPPQKRKRKTA